MTSPKRTTLGEWGFIQGKWGNSKLDLEKWLKNNPLFSKIHNKDGEYYTVTKNKQTQFFCQSHSLIQHLSHRHP